MRPIDTRTLINNLKRSASCTVFVHDADLAQAASVLFYDVLILEQLIERKNAISDTLMVDSTPENENA